VTTKYTSGLALGRNHPLHIVSSKAVSSSGFGSWAGVRSSESSVPMGTEVIVSRKFEASFT